MTNRLNVPKFKTYRQRKTFHSSNNLAMTEDIKGNWVRRSDAENLADKLQQAYKRIIELESNPHAVNLSCAATDVLAERERQIGKKGYTESRDDKYLPGVLNLAGAAYAVSVSAIPDAKRRAQRLWPWPDAGKYLDSSQRAPRPALIKAAALILAEIERIDRAGITVQGDELHGKA